MNKNNTKTTTAKISRKSVIILLVTLFLILIIVITGLCVRFLLEENLSRIILISLILILCIIGLISLITLEIMRRRANKNNKTINNLITNNATRYEFNPTAPPLSGRTSWAYQKSGSKRTTMEA